MICSRTHAPPRDITSFTFHFPGLILWASFQAAYLCFLGCLDLCVQALKQIQLNFFQTFQLLSPAKTIEFLSEAFDTSSRPLGLPIDLWGTQTPLCMTEATPSLFLCSGLSSLSLWWVLSAQIDAGQMNKSVVQPNDQVRTKMPITVLVGILNLLGSTHRALHYKDYTSRSDGTWY